MQKTLAPVAVYINDAITFFKNNIGSLALLVLPYAVLNELAMLFYIKGQNVNEQLISILLLELLLFPILRTGVILFCAARVSGHSRSVWQCYSYSVQFWPRMLLLTVFVMASTTAGLFLFFIPGIFLLIRFSLSEMFCILGNNSLLRSINLSFVATGSPWGWLILKGLLILFPIITGITLLTSNVIVALDIPLLTPMLTLLLSVLRCLYIIFMYRIYTAWQQQNG